VHFHKPCSLHELLAISAEFAVTIIYGLHIENFIAVIPLHYPNRITTLYAPGRPEIAVMRIAAKFVGVTLKIFGDFFIDLEPFIYLVKPLAGYFKVL
jgi:hypothetical protein